MNPWLILILELIGIAYLCVVAMIAFKERSMIVSLVIVNIAIWVYTIFNPQFAYDYALSAGKLKTGAGITLISYMFLHANFAHLFFNSLGMLFFGYNLEKEIGGPPTIMVFFVSGLVGGAVFSMTAPTNALVVGASGGVFGLMAYLTLIRPLKITPMPFIIPLPIAVASVLYALFAIPLFTSGGLLSGGVAHAAHIGGIIGGALMAFGMMWFAALKGLLVVILVTLLILLVPPLL